MKKNKIELDVDSIGNQKETLTKDEEKRISDYIKRNKPKRTIKSPKKKIIAS